MHVLPVGLGVERKIGFVEIMKELAGDYGTATSTELITIKKNGAEAASNMIARLKGSRLVVGSELQRGAHLNESKVKEMTGQDTMSARFLYKEFFDFVPQFKLWIRCNDRPVISGQDHGIWRRVRCIPFDVTIADADKDPDLKAKLEAELLASSPGR